MKATVRTAVVLVAALACGGCFTNHFERRPTPENLIADGLNNTVMAAVAVPVLALAVPVVIAHEIADAVHTEPCCNCVCDPCVCVCEDGDERCGAGQVCGGICCDDECTPVCYPPAPARYDLPRAWYPGWEGQPARPAGPPPARTLRPGY